ncbi:MAG: hypothetical protein WDM88_12025 [Galbitalea sp.]
MPHSPRPRSICGILGRPDATALRHRVGFGDEKTIADAIEAASPGPRSSSSSGTGMPSSRAPRWVATAAW